MNWTCHTFDHQLASHGAVVIFQILQLLRGEEVPCFDFAVEFDKLLVLNLEDEIVRME